MARASHAETAQRLNLARKLLRQSDNFAQAVHKLAGSCAISIRQAYRYLHDAEQLKASVPVVPAKIPFTVKLPENLVKRLHRYVKRSRSTLSEVVGQAVIAWLDRGRGRG
jgi:Ribbon-helix-helix protein, copG family